MIGTTDLCNLAQALCKGEHFLGSRRYSPVLLWLGMAMVGLGAAAMTPPRRD